MNQVPSRRPAPGSDPHAGSTSLKWGWDGELSPVDLQRVLERLCDPSLTECQLGDGQLGLSWTATPLAGNGMGDH